MSEKGNAWIDVVGAHGVSEQVAQLVAAQQFNVTGRLDSHRGTDKKWRLRVWADAIEVELGRKVDGAAEAL